MPLSAIRKFSRRTDRIEEEARRRGIDDPEEKARLGGLTRERKDKGLTWKELRGEWDNRLTPQERQELDRAQGSVRDALGVSRAAALQAEGEALTLEEAVAYALEADDMQGVADRAEKVA